MTVETLIFCVLFILLGFFSGSAWTLFLLKNVYKKKGLDNLLEKLGINK